jgi:hypothetical protein
MILKILGVWFALNLAIPAFIIYQRSPHLRHRLFRLTYRMTVNWSFQELIAFKQPMYFVGTIAYFDKNKSRRETGFCYVFDLNSGSWRRTESKAHNYAY